MSEQQSGSGARQRWILPALALLFFGPLVAAWVFYLAGDDWRPGAAVNHGRLVTPPVLLESTLLPPALEQSSASVFRQTWSLVVVGDGVCEAGCVAAVDKARRVRLALREKSTRVQRVLLHAGALPDTRIFTAHAEGLVTVDVTTDAGKELLVRFNAADPASNASWQTYIVDPLGNVLMVFAPDYEMQGMLADLKRLLKLSRIG